VSNVKRNVFLIVVKQKILAGWLGRKEEKNKNKKWGRTGFDRASEV
jgi:hypothetical protein